MSALVPVIVCAHNEEKSLGATLAALALSLAYAEARSTLAFDLRVVLDRCTDATESVARRCDRATVLFADGGKVEAQRVGLSRGAGPFALFCDADVLPDEPAVHHVAQTLARNPHVAAAHPTLVPLQPLRHTPLAHALYVYNARRGFERRREAWFSGRFVALRRWSAPTREELSSRVRLLARDRFYVFERGLCVDDVYLSRATVAAHGDASIAHVPEARVWFAPPETLSGMYRYYRRLRWELERIDALFPALKPAHRARVEDPARRAQAPLGEQAAVTLFDAALTLCRAGYSLERAYYQHLCSANDFDPWPPIDETKRSAMPYPSRDREDASP